MSEENLQVNDLVQIVVHDERFHAQYPSRVEEVNAQEVVIAWPTEKKEQVPIAAMQIVWITFIRRRRLYMFEGVVQETRTTPIPSITIRPSSPPRPAERRSDLRVRTPVPVTLTEKVISLSSYRDSRELTSIQAYTTTISAGGFTIRHRTPLAIGTLFDVSISLPERPDPLAVSAKAVRCDLRSHRGPERYEIGFAYSYIPESARARIVRFVFKAQIDEIEADS
jgi:c-di-GMP-binding flagellar brake protein YcgR